MSADRGLTGAAKRWKWAVALLAFVLLCIVAGGVLWVVALFN